MKTKPLLFALFSAVVCAAAPLDAWRSNVKIRPVIEHADRHVIHTYFELTPESPDGRFVLYYTSPDADAGHHGDIRILERATGRETILATGIAVEDAHRVACQQWSARGDFVVFHNVVPMASHAKGEQWQVVALEVKTGQTRILATDHQVRFGSPVGDEVPIIGLHWAPGEFRDLEYVNVRTGKTRIVITANAVRAAYPDLIKKRFGDRPVSIFAPNISPDGKRVFFKMAAGNDEDYRSTKASSREMLVAYDDEAKKFLFAEAEWGHPAWTADSRHITNIGGVLQDSTTKTAARINDFPRLIGSHPSCDSSGKLWTSDSETWRSETQTFGPSPRKGDWCVMVGDMKSNDYCILTTFVGNQGATSWRKNHPHPVFSPDGKRIYFNENAGKFTRLMVAEVTP